MFAARGYRRVPGRRQLEMGTYTIAPWKSPKKCKKISILWVNSAFDWMMAIWSMKITEILEDDQDHMNGMIAQLALLQELEDPSPGEMRQMSSIEEAIAEGLEDNPEVEQIIETINNSITPVGQLQIWGLLVS